MNKDWTEHKLKSEWKLFSQVPVAQMSSQFLNCPFLSVIIRCSRHWRETEMSKRYYNSAIRETRINFIRMGGGKKRRSGFFGKNRFSSIFRLTHIIRISYSLKKGLLKGLFFDNRILLFCIVFFITELVKGSSLAHVLLCIYTEPRISDI